MGKKKENVSKATEKIVRFLRDYHLNLNEKTRVRELEDAHSIRAMRIFSDYDDVATEIPEDEFSRIEETVPNIIEKIKNGENVEKLELRNLKYYLKIATQYDIMFLFSLIEIIPLRPSLVVPIVQYLTEAFEFFRNFGDPLDFALLDGIIEKTYYDGELSEWSKFWMLKLIVSNEELMAKSIVREIKKIIALQKTTIFKVVGLYHEAMKGQKIEVDLVNRFIEESKNNTEKSLYYFFLTNAFKNARATTIRSCIEKALNANSHEINLIGCYLLQNNPKIKIDDFDGIFSSYILDKKQPKKDEPVITSQQIISENYYIVSGNNLLPVASPASLFGMQRPKRLRHSVDLIFPELVCWEKVMLKMKEGMEEIEIFYDNEHIETADYIELGFYTGKKQKKPNRHWGFLCALSVLAATDIREATPEKMRCMIAVKSKTTLSTGNVHQIKRMLVKRLREIFKTSANPFSKNREYYEPIFSILPEPDLRKEEVWRQGGRLNENRLPEYSEE